MRPRIRLRRRLLPLLPSESDFKRLERVTCPYRIWCIIWPGPWMFPNPTMSVLLVTSVMIGVPSVAYHSVDYCWCWYCLIVDVDESPHHFWAVTNRPELSLKRGEGWCVFRCGRIKKDHKVNQVGEIADSNSPQVSVFPSVNIHRLFPSLETHFAE